MLGSAGLAFGASASRVSWTCLGLMERMFVAQGQKQVTVLAARLMWEDVSVFPLSLFFFIF